MIRLLCIFIFLLCPVTASAQSVLPNEKGISVATTQDSLIRYNNFVESKGGDPLAITDFTATPRSVVSLVLMMQALHLGGNKLPIEFYIGPNYARNLHEVRIGNAVIMGGDTWDTEQDFTLLMSDPIIEKGQFQKAIYGRADNKRLMGLSTVRELQHLVGVTGLAWTIDIEAFEQMKITKLVQAPMHKLHDKIILAGRADFGLLEPAAKNMREALPEGLAVVEGLSISLDHSRHFMVSTLHPNGAQTYDALQRGLAIMKEKGLIQKAFTDCGFFNEELHSWRQLYP
ncbi:MAG: hypothetical protein ACNI27_02050 [Desulfovibrio sp.]